MRKKGHKLRDGKKLWFSKYSSRTRGQGSASPGNWLDMHSLGPHLSPTESEMGWSQQAMLSQAFQNIAPHTQVWESLV